METRPHLSSPSGAKCKPWGSGHPTNTLLGIPAQVLGLGPASKPGKAALGLILPQTQHGAEPSPIITGAKAPNSQQGKSNRSPLAAPR